MTQPAGSELPDDDELDDELEELLLDVEDAELDDDDEDDGDELSVPASGAAGVSVLV